MASLKDRPAYGALGDRQCPVCSAPIDWRSPRLTKTCGRWKCRAAHRTEEMRRHKEERHQQYYSRCLERATALRDTIATAYTTDDPVAYAVIITAANKHRLVPLPRSRRYRFTRRLMDLVDQALQNPPETLLLNQSADEFPASALPILVKACANCLGHCCLRGGTRAYLDVSTIHRYKARHPEADFRQIIEAYCRLLPAAVYEDSCIFHSSAGCTLPGDMRSNTCLNTVCGGLVEIRSRITLDNQTKFFLAASDKQGVVRSQFTECE